MHIYDTVVDAGNPDCGLFFDEAVGRLYFNALAFDFGVADQGQAGGGNSRITYLKIQSFQRVQLEVQSLVQSQPVHGF